MGPSLTLTGVLDPHALVKPLSAIPKSSCTALVLHIFMLSKIKKMVGKLPPLFIQFSSKN